MYRRSPFVMMNRILRTVLYPDVLLRLKYRRLSVNIAQSLKVKVLDGDNGNMRICFKYGSAHNSMNVSKTETLEEFLSRIKRVVTIHRQRDQLFGNHYESVLNGDEAPEDVEVCLIHNDQHIENSLPCVDAWTLASFLKIGQLLYEVDQDTPTVIKLSLPVTILAGCVIRPHFIIEHGNAYESSFVWYHSVSEEEAEMLKKSVKSKDMLVVSGQWWLKIHEGFLYWTSQSDLGRKLRVVCTPRSEKRGGETFSAESSDVLSGPERFPFEERHLHTKQLTSSDSIRCLSYNILANVYVETKKFPYCSRTAIDGYYRKQLLFKELLGYNSDVLCLQEVQERNYEYDLLPVLQKFGYDGFYMKKGGRRSEGLACFFRTSKFKVISNEGVLLNNVITNKDIFKDFLAKVSGSRKDLSKLLAQDSALQILLLEHADNPRRRILVANTHLYSNKDMPEVRLLQSAMCAVYLEHVLLKMQDDGSRTGLLFCGDFNSLPDSSVLQFLLQGSCECHPSWNKNTLESTDATLRHNLSLESACGFPEYTNYTEQFSGCLDYIFYNKNIFSVSDIVPFPSHESVTQEVGLPSELFPSDHIPIICTLKWK